MSPCLNLRVINHLPWAMLVAVLVLAFWVSTLGRRWSSYKLLAVPSPTVHLKVYFALSVLACVAVLIVQGAFFGLRVDSLRVAGDVSYLFVASYALLVPILGAVLEEVSFRGILQGNLESAFGTRIGAWVSGTTFVGLHGFNPAFVPQLGLYVSVAFFTGLVAARTKSVLPGIAIHLLVNFWLAWVPLALGPVPLGQLPKVSLACVAVVGIAAFIGAGWNLRLYRKACQ